MAERNAVKAPRPPVFTLPELRAFDGAELEAEGDYDGVEFDGLDLTGTQASGARFMDCALRQCVLDEARLKRARIMDTVLAGVRGVGTDLADAQLRDVEISEARLGGVQLSGATLTRVVVRGGKIDYLNLRQSRLVDVAFVGCVLVEPDLGGARCERVSFEDCDVRGADLSAATLKDVDLRGAVRLELARGVDRLSGAVISPGQLLDLAPLFAAELGVRVESR
ncbi:pentapeptide repeat-containing protein [Streptomyces litchfieldiae]|uniref:Pentapeptide repeat-containing protein n=1 Tax=Streptomyces litchfieldiae TaxID=3075543 RepID=A0ABU2MNX2_9ACTN|nr:pentapeptide repeat-containing protein [Streptomyces sp. DSM 44938]MDT0343323.1 pentapeptide repeat-containing protein [Streptomyces sp. DSM 44938]